MLKYFNTPLDYFANELSDLLAAISYSRLNLKKEKFINLLVDKLGYCKEFAQIKADEFYEGVSIKRTILSKYLRRKFKDIAKLENQIEKNEFIKAIIEIFKEAGVSPSELQKLEIELGLKK